MIKFYGVFQLAKIHKEDVTAKNNKVVYFTAVSNRGEDKSDFKFFKIFGQSAEYMMRNLQKIDGDFKSRKMFIEGHVETYKENKEVETTASLKKDSIPEQIGYLNKNLKIKTTATIPVYNDVYIVSRFEFVDKKKDSEVEVLVDDGISYEDEDDSVIVDDTPEEKTKSSTKSQNADKGLKGNFEDAFKQFENTKGIAGTL